ncbi:MAG: gliding motility protein GldC [Flavobacteriales bacterium]|nr:gliding motility protein GldC [Flavobacteriales bacterium]PIE86946.1 MAG: gliding motility protein GldC [Bacteroidota bacterium]
MEDKVVKTSAIELKVGMNENNLPVRMKWSAEDGDVKDAEARAFLLSIWDPAAKNTMKIDLWTKDMSIEEMKQFFHQTLLTMSDTFEKATGEHNICEDLRDYCYHFADKMKILPEQ